MWTAMILLIGILVVIIVMQRVKEIHRNHELDYVIDKLDDIMSTNTREQINVVTADPQVRRLTASINDILEENSQNFAGYIKSQESMKKMLANISHDLKTPLTVVLGYLEMECLQEKDERIQLVYQKVQDVITMMNEFFDLAKLEARDKKYPMEQVNVAELLRVCVLNFYSQLNQQHAKVEIQIPEQNLYIESNQEALNRIFNNLISNAVRYGMDGRYLEVRLTEEEKQVRIEVTDRGKGIPAKHQEEVFERLYTLEDSRSSEYQGSGLGLSITRELVSMMHGKIALASIPYEKTTFTVCLPK